MICVSIGFGSPSEAKKTLHKSGFIELRADMLNWEINEYRDVIQSGGRTVFTCRPGKFSEDERLELFEMASSAGARYIDCEIESNELFLEAVRRITERGTAELIISYHNYELTPQVDLLESVLSDCFDAGADVAKIACRTYSPSDAARLLSLYGHPGRKIVLGMGKAGKITRVAATLLGAEFTFAAPEESDGTAEGQFDFEEMKDIIRKIQ